MTEKKVAFVTGASSGIGYATALAFANRGVHVTGTSRSLDRLETLESAAQPFPGEIHRAAVEVQNAESVQSAVDATMDRFGRLDIVVANAGIGHRGTIVEADWYDVETLLRTNIDGMLHTVRAGVPALRQSGGGHIVLLSSVVFNMTAPYAAYYAASKAFVSSIGRSLRLELEADNIYVSDMIVGRTDTQFNANRLGGQRTGGGVPRMQPDQVAEAIVRAVETRQKTVTLRFLDRLTILGNILVPNVIGHIVKRQYK